MSHRKVTISLGEFYHLYSRGVDKCLVFRDEQDRKRFVKLLFLCNGTAPIIYKDYRDLSFAAINTGRKIVSLGAYCLMPNHFHVLIKETSEGGTVKFMSKLLTAYSSYFNKKYLRTGPLFSSEFKSEHLDSDPYLKYIFAYIHLNPMKILDSEWRTRPVNLGDATQFLARYPYSSYADYAEPAEREEGHILNKAVFPGYFNGAKEFNTELEEWLTFNN